MRTVVVRLADAAVSDGGLHGVLEVVGGTTSTFSGALDLLRQLRAVASTPVGGVADGGVAPAGRDGSGTT